MARNHLGSMRKVVTLEEGHKPGVPRIVAVENIDQVRRKGKLDVNVGIPALNIWLLPFQLNDVPELPLTL